MITSGRMLVIREYDKQKEKWGMEHDRKEHGLSGLAEVAGLLLRRAEPDWGAEGYDESEWFVQLFRKHDFFQRCVIASAMLMCGADCEVYENTLRLMNK